MWECSCRGCKAMRRDITLRCLHWRSRTKLGKRQQEKMCVKKWENPALIHSRLFVCFTRANLKLDADARPKEEIKLLIFVGLDKVCKNEWMRHLECALFHFNWITWNIKIGAKVLWISNVCVGIGQACLHFHHFCLLCNLHWPPYGIAFINHSIGKRWISSCNWVQKP